MHFWDRVNHYIDTTRGMRQYLRLPREQDWRGRIRRNLDNRGEVWIETLRRTVFGVAAHPYKRMFALAGCTLEDLSAEVRRHGVEKALEQLRAAGVRLSHDEFKGIARIVRGGEEIPAATMDFANPLAMGWLEGRSSGSRSRGSVTLTGSAHLDHLTGYAALNVEEFGMRGGPYVIVRPILPGIAGLYFCLFHSRLGCEMGPWFVYGGSGANSLHYRALTTYMLAMARMRGWRVPPLEFLSRNDFTPVAELLARECRSGRKPTLQTVASVGSRIASAAREMRLDLDGTVFVSGGEPMTPGKRGICEAAGMRVHPAYWVSEIGQIGHSCRHMGEGNSVHIFEDSVGVISETRLAPYGDETVNALLLTSLNPCAPYVLINCEMGDSGVVEDCLCGCEYGRAGFGRRIRDISSFGKLTGIGMTLVGSDVLRIIEMELPARLGGGPADYQLVQHEAGGQTALTLRVSPRVPANPDQARKLFLDLLGGYQGGTCATRVWEHVRAVEAVRGEPIQTSGGKTLPLHLARVETLL